MTITAEYQELLIQHTPRVIRTKAEHKRALATIDRLMRLARPTAAQRQMLELLSLLVERYEEETDPAPEVPPQRLIAHLLSARGANQSDLARATGLARSVISEIIAGRKAVSVRTARKLAQYFGVPPTLFLAIGE